MNRNDRQTFALLLVQVAVVLPKGGMGGEVTQGVLGGTVQLGTLELVLVCLPAPPEMHFHCIHFGGFHYVAKVLHLALARTCSASLSLSFTLPISLWLCACKFSVTCPCRAHSKVILSY